MAFKTRAEIVNDMLQDYFEITGEQLSPSDLSHELVLKAWTFAGAISSLYSDITQARDDIWPGSAGTDGLINHLAERLLPTQIAAQPSVGVLRITGTVGSTIPAGLTVKRALTGDQFIGQGPWVVGASGHTDVPFESLLAGQAYNVDAVGETFNLLSAPAGLDANCTNTVPFRDGRDLETPEEMLARIEAHDLSDDTGGNLVAYERLAQEASNQVVSATGVKNPRGPDTVNVIITSGTTDIETAIRNGQAVVRVPSSPLLAVVQAYVAARNPTTDDFLAVAPTEATFPVTINYNLYDESGRAAVDAEIVIQTKIFLYSAKSAQVIQPTQLERQIDSVVGHLMSARRVGNFGGGSPAYTVPAGTLLTPGTITTGAL
jgi:hypothetical protein